MTFSNTWLTAFLLLALGTASCVERPDYLPIPQIEFEALRFVDVPDPGLGDSLILTLAFTDGDGDLGLNSTQTGVENVNGNVLFFNNRFYFTKNNMPALGYLPGQRLTYADKRTRPELDLPDYVRPHTCINWEIITENNIRDTVYFELNENHYNIFVDFLIKQDDGSFVEFDWRERFCSTFDGRFPELSRSPGDDSPLRGKINYSMVSAGFKFQFSLQTLKLRVQIQDRMQQRSNVVETPEFQFR